MKLAISAALAAARSFAPVRSVRPHHLAWQLED